MTKKKPDNQDGSQIILYQTEDGRMRIECLFENETVWLTQALIAELFQVGVNTINHHLKEIYEDGELFPEATIRNYRIVRTEGKREVITLGPMLISPSWASKPPFTLDIVLDEHLHQMGCGIKTKDNIWVADINTLLATKIGALVSRCSEKDLFDLSWLLEHSPEYKIENLIEIGAQIDAGLNVETLLVSLQE